MTQGELREFDIGLVGTAPSATAKVRATSLKEAQEKGERGEWYSLQEDKDHDGEYFNEGWIFGAVLRDSLGNEF